MVKITHNQNALEWLLDMQGNVEWEMNSNKGNPEVWGKMFKLRRAVSFVIINGWNAESPKNLYV